MLKWGNLSLRREDNYENVLMKEKVLAHQREKKLEQILSRMKRIDDIK